MEQKNSKEKKQAPESNSETINEKYAKSFGAKGKLDTETKGCSIEKSDYNKK